MDLPSNSQISKCSKATVENDLKRKLGKYLLIQRGGSTVSDVWKRFGVIFNSETQREENLCACWTCLKVYNWTRATGVSTLRRHNCSSGKTDDRQRTLSSFKKVSITKEMRDMTTKHVVRMCAQDFRPFNIVKCEGFRAYSEWLLELGGRN